jgi:hypothetical protein
MQCGAKRCINAYSFELNQTLKLGFILDGRCIRQKRNAVIIFNTYCFVPDYNYIHLQYLRFVVYDVIIQCHSVYIMICTPYPVLCGW